MGLLSRVLRVEVDLDYPLNRVLVQIVREIPRFYAASEINFELGILRSGQVVDLEGDVSSIFVAIKARKSDGSPPGGSDEALMLGSSSNIVSNPDWAGGSQAHASINFDDNEANISPGLHWILFYAITTAADTVPLGAGLVEVLAGGSNTAPAPDMSDDFYTSAEIDALLAGVPKVLPNITGFTGGASSDLDSVSISNLSAGSIIICPNLGSGMTYVLRAGDPAENAPFVVKVNSDPTNFYWSPYA